MAGEIIRPEDLTPRPSPVASELMVVDNGVNVGAATIKAIVEAGRPAASQAEAQAGTDAAKAMTPLTTKQSIAAEVGVTIASKAQGDLASTAVQPGDLGDLATKDTVNNADWSGADLAIENGGTGASSPSAARDSLGLGSAAIADADDFASAAQGAKADTALQSIVAGSNVTVDATDPQNPIVSATGGASGTILIAEGRTALKALASEEGAAVYLNEGGRSGIFAWTLGDFSELVSADTREALYAPADDVAVTAGCWVRQRSNLNVCAEWFGAVGDGVTNDQPALQAGINIACSFNALLLLDAKNYKINSTLVSPATGWRTWGIHGVGTGNHQTAASGGTCIVTNGTYDALDVKMLTFANENYQVKGVAFYNVALDRLNGGVAIRTTRGAANGRYVSGFIFENVSTVGFNVGFYWVGQNGVNSGFNFFGNISLKNCNIYSCGYAWVQGNASCNLVSWDNVLVFDCPYGGISILRDGGGISPGRNGCINIEMSGKTHFEAVGGMFRTQLTPMLDQVPANPSRSRITMIGLTHEVCGATISGGVATGDPWQLGVETDVYVLGMVDDVIAYGESAVPAVGPSNTITSASRMKVNLAGGTDKSPAGMVTAP